MARGGDRGNQYTKVANDHFNHLPKYKGTAEKIAAEHGVGVATVRRAENFYKGVDTAEKIGKGTRDAILSGKSKVPRSVIAELPKMEPDERG